MPRPLYTPRPIIGQGFNTMDWITPERLRERQKRLREEKRQPIRVTIGRDPAQEEMRRLGDQFVRAAGQIHNISTAAGRRALSAAVCRGLHNVTCRMFNIYAFGTGAPQSLRSLGIANTFRNHRSVRTAVRDFNHFLVMAAVRDATNLRCTSGTRRIQDRFSNTTTTNVNEGTTSPLYAIANSTFFRSGDYRAVVNCSERTMDIELNMEFRIRDRFADPFDLRRLRLDVEIPGARPYNIIDKWRERRSLRGIRYDHSGLASQNTLQRLLRRN